MKEKCSHLKAQPKKRTLVERTVYTGFRQGRIAKALLVREATKRGWSVSRLVEKIVTDWLASERKKQ